MRAKQFSNALKAVEGDTAAQKELTDHYEKQGFILYGVKLLKRKIFFLFDDASGLEIKFIDNKVMLQAVDFNQRDTYMNSLTPKEVTLMTDKLVEMAEKCMGDINEPG